MGDLYVDGVGVSKDYKQAFNWYKKAAAKNMAAAQYSVGAMYANGYGVGRNMQEAKKWFQKAAKQGNAKGKNALAIIKKKGL